MKRCFIFAAGTYYGLRERPQTGDLVLAADAGYLACRQAGITPDLLLGDFDSMDQPADFDHVCRVPVEKDDTDTMLAVKTGLEQGCGEFYIYGGTGGRRLDHTLANLQTLLYTKRDVSGFRLFFSMCDLSMRHVCFLPKGIILYRSMSAICIKGNAGSNSRTSSKDRVQCRSHLGPLPGKDIPRRI